jgi:hypothetical protein
MIGIELHQHLKRTKEERRKKKEERDEGSEHPERSPTHQHASKDHRQPLDMVLTLLSSLILGRLCLCCPFQQK